MGTTVDSIFSNVERLLSSKIGRERATKQRGSLDKTLKMVPEIEEMRKLLGSRRGATLCISTSDARKKSPITVRVGGSICGRIEVVGRGQRWFRPEGATFKALWPAGSADRLEWSDPRVRAFVGEAVEIRDEKGAPEKSVEAELIDQLRANVKSGHLAPLRRLRPVLLAGCPIQVPLPVRASKGPPSVSQGFIDILARGDSRFRVIEIKAPGAQQSEVSHALDQAVAYCAALEHLMKGPGRKTYLSLLGMQLRTGEQRIPIDAAVAVEEAERERVVEAARRLDGSNARVRLIGMFYRWNEKRDFGDRLRVRSVEVLAKPRP